MEINRSNYEIWIIDWLDGNLNYLQVEQLKLFLNENPELREEFKELNTLSLKPVKNSFPQKHQLKKTTADLSGSQFEYLCVAYLENDLTDDQQTELFETIGLDPEKKSAFELIQKMRLVPAGITYKYKHKLKKRTLLQNVIRLSVIGLSAAATIALVVMTYFFIPRNLSDKSNDGVLSFSAKNIVADSNGLQPAVNKLTEKKLTENKIDIAGKKRENLVAVVQKTISGIPQSKSPVSVQNDSLHIITGNYVIGPEKIPVHAAIELKGGIISNTLVVSNLTLSIPVNDDERSRLSRFIAKTFREKILKENTSKDSPLKGYEIAEAGITGLNKLLGWEMALDKKNDEYGNLRSVYFSSKLLKFNAPVKKSDFLP